MKKLIFLSFIVSFFISCSDSSTDPINPPIENDGVLPTKIVIDDGSGSLYTAQFNYTDDKLTSISDSEDLTEYIYTGDFLTKVTYTDGSETAEAELEYEGNLLSKFVVSSNMSSSTIIYSISEATQNMVYIERYFGDANGENWDYDGTDELTFLNGNIIKHRSSDTESIDDADTVYEYTFDTNNGAFRNIYAINILNLLGVDFGGLESGITNNILTMKEYYNGELDYTESYTYTYNDNGYPASRDLFIDGEYQETQEFYYNN